MIVTIMNGSERRVSDAKIEPSLVEAIKKGTGITHHAVVVIFSDTFGDREMGEFKDVLATLRGVGGSPARIDTTGLTMTARARKDEIEHMASMDFVIRIVHLPKVVPLKK
jgi:hypothetical protein